MSLYHELISAARERFGDSHSGQTMAEWICANTTLKRKPFTFRDYPFQEAIVNDMHQDLSVKKCSQVGLTETQLRKSLAIMCRNNGIAGIFSLPNEKMFTKVYNTRLKPMLEMDKIFNPPTEVQPVRRRDTVQIKDSFLYITGCTEGDATSTPADFLMHDELDLSPEDMIGLYQSRLQNSEHKITQKFSTPTFVGFGIDKSYALSDQREYLYRCSSCNHWQIPLFTPKFVHVPDFNYDVTSFAELTPEQVAVLNTAEAYVHCEKCQRRADLSDSSLREWVATFPLRTTFRGYQVRPTCTNRIAISYIFSQLVKYQQQGYVRGFYNTVLGEPYADASAQIQRADIEACMQEATIPNVSENTPVYLGVDIGLVCHITLSIDDPSSGQPVWVLFETVPVGQLETRLGQLRKVYNIVQGASDRFPFTPTVDALRDMTHGLVMPVQYRGNAALQPVKDELGNLVHYSASNTLILDRLHTLIAQKKMVIRGYTSFKETIIANLTDMVRDEQPDGEAVWKKRTGNDHYLHAMALNLLSRRICEHMFHINSDVIATSSALIGAHFGVENKTTLMSPTNRISRLGKQTSYGKL